MDVTHPFNNAAGGRGRFGQRQPIIASALVVAAVFANFGIQAPYFPLWLGKRGLSASEIALVMSAPLFLRLAISPWIGALADRRPDRRGLIAGLVLISMACAVLLLFAHGFWPIFLLATIMLLAFQPVQPVVDATVGLLVRHGIARDFGRIRLWGSVSFAIVAMVAGWMLEHGSIEMVFGVLIGLQAMTIAAAWLLPLVPSPDKPVETPAFLPWKRPDLMFVFGGIALINASQAMYFGFGTVHMLAIGYPSWSIGLLWTVAVVAEIVVLWFAPMVLLRLGPNRLLMAAAIGTFIRWLGMALDPPLIGMLALQSLHACTLSCTYLGLMAFIQHNVEPEAAARAQSASQTATGLLLASMTLVTGPIYNILAGQTYLVMAILPALAVPLLFLRRSWRR